MTLGAALVLAPGAFASRGSLDPGPLTAGTTFAVAFQAASPDGQTVVFSTTEKLVDSDTDGVADLYVSRGSAAPALLTPGVSAFGPEFRAGTVKVLAGGQVVFITGNKLAGPDDADSQNDLYLVRTDGTAVNVSDTPGTGEGVTPVPDAYQVAADGSALSFNSRDRLTIDDTQDNVDDVYRYVIGASTPLELVTRGTAAGVVTGISVDGSRVYWESNLDQPPLQADSGAVDLYVSAAPFASVASPTVASGGDGVSSTQLYAGESPDGTTVVVRTPERFDNADTTQATTDLYALKPAGGERWLTQQVEGSPGEGGSTLPAGLRTCNDGSVVLTTAKRLTGTDLDTGSDLYRVTTSGTRLLSGGAGTTAGVSPAAVAADCTRAAWVTTANETAGDSDTAADLFLGDGASITQLSAVPTGGTDGAVVAPTAANVPVLGDRLFFATTAVLGGGDRNLVADVYEARPATGALSLISGGQAAAGSGLALVAAGPAAVVVATADRLAPSDTDNTADLYRYLVTDGAPDPFPGTSTAPPGPPAPPAATPSAGTVALTAQGLKATLKKGKATLKTPGSVTCTGGPTACALVATAKAGTKQVAAQSASVPGGSRQQVALRLTKAGLKRLTKAGKLTLTVNVSLTRPGSTPVTTTVVAKVKAPRKR